MKAKWKKQAASALLNSLSTTATGSLSFLRLECLRSIGSLLKTTEMLLEDSKMPGYSHHRLYIYMMYVCYAYIHMYTPFCGLVLVHTKIDLLDPDLEFELQLLQVLPLSLGPISDWKKSSRVGRIKSEIHKSHGFNWEDHDRHGLHHWLL